MTLLPSLLDLLQVFSAEMTAPTFRNFLVVTAGWLFATRHTVASAVLASGNARNRHHSAFYSTFSRAAWDVDQVGWNLARTVLERYWPRVDKPVEICADDTNAAKSGRKIFGTGWHYDPRADSPKGKRYDMGPQLGRSGHSGRTTEGSGQTRGSGRAGEALRAS